MAAREWTLEELSCTPDDRARIESEAAEADTRCRACLTEFDPSDLRFDGAARYPGTPWCKRCVDRCHESTDFAHVCPVCEGVSEPFGSGAARQQGEVA